MVVEPNGELVWVVVQTGQVLLEACPDSFEAELSGSEFLVCGLYHFYNISIRRDVTSVHFQLLLQEEIAPFL